MHYFTKLGFILGGFLSCQAFAATFSVPEYFDIMYVDREKTSSFNTIYEVELDAGQHELVVRYSERVERLSEDYTFRSEPIIIDLQVGEQDKLILDAVYPETVRQAEAFEDNPEFKIVNQQGDLVDYQSQMLPGVIGFQLGRNYLKEIAELKGEQSSAAELAALKASLEKTDETVKVDSSTAAELELLKQWYKKADSDTQIAYRLWIIDPSIVAQKETKELKMLKQLHSMASETAQKELQIWMIKQP